jgi:dolichol kinase
MNRPSYKGYNQTVVQPVDSEVRYRHYLRKGTHIALGSIALTLKFLPAPYHIVFTGILALGAWILRPYYPLVIPMARPTELRDGVLWGVRYYFGTIFAVSLIFYEHPEITAATWLVLALGDGLSATIGGPASMPVPWNRKKRLAGTFACFVGAFVAMSIAFVWYNIDITPVLLFQAIALSMAVAIFESLNTPLDDNLIIGLGASLIMLATGMFV